MQKFREFVDLKKERQQRLTATNGTNGTTATPAGPKTLAAPSDSDQYRYRRFEGVNMGSWFVNEEWICQSVFKSAASPQQSDLDICKGSNAKSILENHWDTWITTSDWEFIVDQGLNTIRLPIGYYHLSQASIISNTDFAAYGSVFSGAWQRVLKAINTAKSYGLGVLVDLHAAPGGQNTQAHSGTSSGQANLWGNSTNLARCLSALQFMVTNLQGIDNVVGVELLNEPKNGSYLAGWYVSTIQALRKISSDFPLYIHDGFDPEYYAKFVGSRTDLGYVVQDTHFYRCFSSSDTSQSSDALIQGVINDTTGFWESVAGWSKGHIICGEWSAALADSSLNQSSRSPNSSRGYFAYVQLAMFETDIAGGWMFWCLKKESGTDTGWSLQNARSANTVPPDFSNYLVVPSKSATNGVTNGNDANGNTKQATMKAALQKFQKQLAVSNSSAANGHLSYEYPNLIGKPTDPTSPATFPSVRKEADTADAQSELFRQGFEQGYQDAKFFSLGVQVVKAAEGAAAAASTDTPVTRTVGGSSIGHLDQWKKIRAKQFVDANPTSSVSSTSSIWDKVLRLLHLRSNTSTSTTNGSTSSTFSNLETTVASVWEYMDGFESGVTAFESGAVDNPDAGSVSASSKKVDDAVEKWGKQFKDPKEGEAGLRTIF